MKNRTSRVTYAQAGEAQRDAIARACGLGSKLNGQDWRVFAAVLYYTATYSRTEDRLTHGFLNKVAGLGRKEFRRSLKKLAALGVIEYVAGVGNRHSVVGLPRGVTPPPLEDNAKGGDLEGATPPSEGGHVAPLEGVNPPPFHIPRRTTEKDYEEYQESLTTLLAPSMRTTPPALVMTMTTISRRSTATS